MQTVTRKKMQTLRDGKWLNDEVLAFYFLILNAQNKLWTARESADGAADGLGGSGSGSGEGGSAEKRIPKCYCFNTYFYSQLSEDHRSYNYKSVKRYTKAAKVIALLPPQIDPIQPVAFHPACSLPSSASLYAANARRPICCCLLPTDMCFRSLNYLSPRELLHRSSPPPPFPPPPSSSAGQSL
jgi:hypothetical protein